MNLSTHFREYSCYFNELDDLWPSVLTYMSHKINYPSRCRFNSNGAGFYSTLLLMEELH